MAQIRHALIGDRTYGGRLKLPAGASDEVVSSLRSFSRQALHASRLAFRHPSTDQWLDFQSPLPRDFVDLLQALDSDEHSSVQNNDPARWDRMRWPEPKSS